MGSRCKSCLYFKDCSPLDKTMEDEECLVIGLEDLYDEEFYRPYGGEFWWEEMSYYWLDNPDFDDLGLSWEELEDYAEDDNDLFEFIDGESGA